MKTRQVCVVQISSEAKVLIERCKLKSAWGGCIVLPDELLHDAPHITPFGRMDEVKAARELVLCCWLPENYETLK